MNALNAESILSYKKDPDEDFYRILGCDKSSSSEQILTEYKARAKDYHPDRNQSDTTEEFKKLQQVGVT